MSKAKQKVNAKTRRQIEKIGVGSVAAYVASRMDILNDAKGWLDDKEIEIDSILDVLVVAEFLAGDRILESE